MATEPLLSVQDLQKHYAIRSNRIGGAFDRSQVKAVNGISFDLHRGETLALVGESGCGKTTTSKLILRLERPTHGRVLLNGTDIHSLRGEAYRRYRTEVQAVFQDPWSSLNPRLRVWDVVSEPLVVNERLTKAEARKRVEQTLVDVGLEPGHADRFPHEFSGGQRQRIAVAEALIAGPSLIVLDEPVSSLDVSIRAQIMNLFQSIRKKYNVSYLLIAHDLATTRFMADKIAVMYLGKIVEYAPSEELFENPLHPYTKALFSAALPSDPKVQREEIILSGEVPSPINPPGGCSFHTRCPQFMGEACKLTIPELAEVQPGHWVSCHLFG